MNLVYNSKIRLYNTMSAKKEMMLNGLTKENRSHVDTGSIRYDFIWL